MYHRCIPKSKDQSWLAIAIILPVIIFVLYWCIRRLVELNFIENCTHTFAKSIFLCFIILLLLGYCALCVHNILWSSSRCMIASDGLHIKYVTGNTRFVPKNKIQDICVCNMYDGMNFKYPIIRFTTDTKLDEKVQHKKRFGSMGLGCPKWLHIDFIGLHSEKIIIIPYSPISEEEALRVFPNLRYVEEEVKYL